MKTSGYRRHSMKEIPLTMLCPTLTEGSGPPLLVGRRHRHDRTRDVYTLMAFFYRKQGDTELRQWWVLASSVYQTEPVSEPMMQEALRLYFSPVDEPDLPSEPNDVSAAEIIKQCADAAAANGWWKHNRVMCGSLPEEDRTELILKLHAIAEEAFEASSLVNKEKYREGANMGPLPLATKFVEELADLYIRVCDLVGHWTTPRHFLRAVDAKLEVNKGRGHRHGGHIY